VYADMTDFEDDGKALGYPGGHDGSLQDVLQLLLRDTGHGECLLKRGISPPSCLSGGSQ
jgi:hypothetical protein